MAIPTIGDVISAIPDPLFSEHFRLSLPSVPGSGDPNPFTFLCKSATKPGMTLTAVEVQIFGQTLEFAGNMTYSHDMSCEYYENRKMQITKNLEGWANFIRAHETQHGGYKSEYGVNGTLEIFDVKGNTVAKYTIYGMWPSAVPDMQFDGSASQALTVQVSWKYDYYAKV